MCAGTCAISDTSSESPSTARQFHLCKSVACISEMPCAAGQQPLLRRLSEPLGRVCTCPSMHHVSDMEGTITFVVPELSEKTIMNVSVSDVESA